MDQILSKLKELAIEENPKKTKKRNILLDWLSITFLIEWKHAKAQDELIGIKWLPLEK